jgi:cytochrome c2
MTSPRLLLALLPLAMLLLPPDVRGGERSLPDPMEGSRLFVGKGCVVCHAVDGEGGKIGPDLGRISAGRSLLGIAAVMWNHSPVMTERIKEVRAVRASLTAEEMANLFAFLAYTAYLDAPGDPKRGADVFRDRGCGRCHTVGGGTAAVGSPLDRFKPYVSPISLATAMWNRGPEMQRVMQQRGIARPQLSGGGIGDLMAYIRVAGRGSPEGAIYLLPGNPERGARVFEEKQCAGCHGGREAPGRIGPSLRRLLEGRRRVLTDVAALMWNHGPAIWKKMAERNIPTPTLTAQEMADLVAHLYSLHYFDEPGKPDRGRDAFASKGCAACHGPAGRGGPSAPDLTKTLGKASPIEIVAAMWNHGSAMAQEARTRGLPWPNLEGRDLADLVEFLRAGGRKK